MAEFVKHDGKIWKMRGHHMVPTTKEETKGLDKSKLKDLDKGPRIVSSGLTGFKCLDCGATSGNGRLWTHSQYAGWHDGYCWC